MQRAWGYLFTYMEGISYWLPYGCLVPPHHDRHSSRARDTDVFYVGLIPKTTGGAGPFYMERAGPLPFTSSSPSVPKLRSM